MSVKLVSIASNWYWRAGRKIDGKQLWRYFRADEPGAEKAAIEHDQGLLAEQTRARLKRQRDIAAGRRKPAKPGSTGVVGVTLAAIYSRDREGNPRKYRSFGFKVNHRMPDGRSVRRFFSPRKYPDLASCWRAACAYKAELEGLDKIPRWWIQAGPTEQEMARADRAEKRRSAK